MQGTRVRALLQEDPTCRGATKPVRHNYWACALEPKPQLLSPRATTTEARAPRARAAQQEKPPQWEARAPQQSSPRSQQLEKACTWQLEKARMQQRRPSATKNK